MRILAVLLLAAMAQAQDTASAPGAETAPFSLGRAQDIAARPMALGGSYSAVANDFTALYYNPAGLTSVKKHEWHFSLDQSNLYSTGRVGGFSPQRADRQALGIQSLGYLLPIPTARGGLSFAFGFYRPRTFSDLISYEDALSTTRGAYRYEADGFLNHYRAGMAVDLAPDITLGLALGYVGGAENILLEDGGEAAYLRSYHGLDFEPALLFKITPRLRLGLSLVAWEKIFDLEEVYEEKGVGNQEANYRVDHPFQLKTGLAYLGSSWLGAADLKINDWGSYRYALQGVDRTTGAPYRTEWIFSLGAEKFMPVLHGVVRGGYTYNTLPERGFTPVIALHRLSAGLGFLLSGALAVDVAYSHAFWELSDRDLYLENREQRALLSLSYRY